MSFTVLHGDKVAPATSESSVWSLSSFIEIFHGKGQVSVWWENSAQKRKLISCPQSLLFSYMVMVFLQVQGDHLPDLIFKSSQNSLSKGQPYQLIPKLFWRKNLLFVIFALHFENRPFRWISNLKWKHAPRVFWSLIAMR